MAKEAPRFSCALQEYETLEIIGEGCSGKVYKVKDEEGTIRAVKCLDPTQVGTERFKRFANELRFCIRNKHDNIISVLDWGHVAVLGKRCPFYVMPYYPKTLRTLIKESILPTAALEYYSQMLNGVEAAHLLNVWHRDLKPENILLDPSGPTLVIADFGIAHFSEYHLQTTVQTSPHDRLANFQYAAPEQRLPGAPVNHRSDIYALGLILNELFTGTVPHGTKFKEIGSASPQHGYLDALVEKMIRQSPDDRPISIDAVKQELLARQNEFVSRQKLSLLTGTVVPHSEPDSPLATNPVRLLSYDYQGGRLLLRLSQKVNPAWADCFREVSMVRYVVGASHVRFEFREDLAILAVSEADDIKGVVDKFPTYLAKATELYKSMLLEQARKREAEENARLKKEIEEEEKRQRILRRIRGE